MVVYTGQMQSRCTHSSPPPQPQGLVVMDTAGAKSLPHQCPAPAMTCNTKQMSEVFPAEHKQLILMHNKKGCMKIEHRCKCKIVTLLRNTYSYISSRTSTVINLQYCMNYAAAIAQKVSIIVEPITVHHIRQCIQSYQMRFFL